jgi:putative transposase
MQVVGLPKALYHVSKLGLGELGGVARELGMYLRCFEALMGEGLCGGKASEILDVPRSTLYRWRQRLREGGPRALEDRSRRPKRRRQPTWSWRLAEAVASMRERYPRWGKDKLAVLLWREGWRVSVSMVGRILSRLKARGVLKEPPRTGVVSRKKARPRPYAVRKPKEYLARTPGDLVQVDTLDIRPLPGVVLKHFTARDVVARWDVVEAHTRATAATATSFLRTLMRRMPFPIRAVQVDGGAEFEAGFEQACEECGIKLFVLPPRSPKLNGHVERAHRTHTEEFYDVYDGELDLPSLNQALSQWETTYNYIRPHQALDGQTPAEYLTKCHPEMAPALELSHM